MASQKSIPLQVPIKGLRQEIGPDLLDNLETPKCLNVHEVKNDIVTRPGLSDFGPNDISLRLFLYYDANDDSQYGLRINTNDNIKLAQSVTTAGAARTVNSIKLKLKRNGTITAGKVVYVTVESDSSGTPSGTPVTNGTSANVLCTAISGTAGWIEFTFATAMTLSVSTKYWIVLQGDYDVSGTNYIEWKIDSGGSSYTDGDAFIFDSSWISAGAGIDFMFRMYRDSSAVMLLDTFYLRAGGSYFIKATIDRLFKWNTGTSAWDDISGYLAVNLFTGTVDDAFCSDTYPGTDTFLVTNYANNIKKWTGSGNCADLGGTPPRAKYLKVYKNRLFLGYVYAGGADQPQRVDWSEVGDIEDWTGGSVGYHLFYENIDSVTGLSLLQDYLVVAKERSMYLGYPVTTTDYFEFNQRVNGLGPVNGNLVGELGGRLLFMSWEDLLSFDGINARSICDDLIKKEFFETIDPNTITRSFSIIMEEVDEWHIFVPSVGASYPDTEWVYNYKRGTFYKYNQGTAVTCAGWYVLDTSVTIANLVGTIQEQIWRFGDRTISGVNLINVLGTYSGLTYRVDYAIDTDDGVAVESYIDTKDFFFLNDSQKRIRGRVLEFSLKGIGTRVDLYYSKDEGASYHFLKTFTLNGSWNERTTNFRLDAENIRWRLYKNGIGQNFRIRQISFRVMPGGRL